MNTFQQSNLLKKKNLAKLMLQLEPLILITKNFHVVFFVILFII